MATWNRFRESPWGVLTALFFLVTVMLYMYQPIDLKASNQGGANIGRHAQTVPGTFQAQVRGVSEPAPATPGDEAEAPTRPFAYTGILALALSLIWFAHAFTGPPNIPRRAEQVQFSYFFVIAAFVILGLPPFVKSQAIGSEPLGIVSGCVQPFDSAALSCFPNPETKRALGGADDNENDPRKAAILQMLPPPMVRNQWLINIGGTLTPQTDCTSNVAADCKPGSKAQRAYITGGLVVPLPLVIVALFGAAISLSRRVPEIQKQSDENYIGTAAQPALTATEATERLAFQIMQFLSAPLIAIVAYEVMRPENEASAMALAFLAGFGSETILLLIRGVAEGIQPKTTVAPVGERVGTVEGVIRAGGKPVSADVTVHGTNLKARADAKGKYVIKQVPAGLQQFSFINNNTVQTRSVSVIAGATTLCDLDVGIDPAVTDLKPVKPLPPDPPAPDASPALTGPAPVGIRIAINDPELDPGTLLVLLDGHQIHAADDGLFAQAALPGVSHLIKASARKNGVQVTSEHSTIPGFDDDGRPISLIFK